MMLSEFYHLLQVEPGIPLSSHCWDKSCKVLAKYMFHSITPCWCTEKTDKIHRTIHLWQTADADLRNIFPVKNCMHKNQCRGFIYLTAYSYSHSLFHPSAPDLHWTQTVTRTCSSCTNRFNPGISDYIHSPYGWWHQVAFLGASKTSSTSQYNSGRSVELGEWGQGIHSSTFARYRHLPSFPTVFLLFLCFVVLLSLNYTVLHCLWGWRKVTDNSDLLISFPLAS